MRYQTPDGGKIVQNFTKTDVDLCHYKVRKIYSTLIVKDLTNTILLNRAIYAIMTSLAWLYPRATVSEVLFSTVTKHFTFKAHRTQNPLMKIICYTGKCKPDLQSDTTTKFFAMS